MNNNEKVKRSNNWNAIDTKVNEKDNKRYCVRSYKLMSRVSCLH